MHITQPLSLRNPGDQLTQCSQFECDAYFLSLRQWNCPVSSLWTLTFLAIHHFVTWPVKPKRQKSVQRIAWVCIGRAVFQKGTVSMGCYDWQVRSAAYYIVLCDLPLSSASLYLVLFIHSSGLLWITSDFHVVKPSGQFSGLILFDLPSLDPVISLSSLEEILPSASGMPHLPAFASTDLATPFSVSFAVLPSECSGEPRRSTHTYSFNNVISPIALNIYHSYVDKCEIHTSIPKPLPQNSKWRYPTAT